MNFLSFYFTSYKTKKAIHGGGDRKKKILWRTKLGAPQNVTFLWRTIPGAPQNFFPQNSPVPPQTTFCGAPGHMRHRNVTFCGAPSTVRHRKSSGGTGEFWEKKFCGAPGLVRHRKVTFCFGQGSSCPSL